MGLQYYLTHVLWIVPAVLQFAVALVMRRRRLEREFPFFFAYTLAQLVRFAGLYFVYHLPGRHYALYFYCYWAAQAVNAVLELAVVYEIYSHLFRRYAALRSLGEVMFRWAMAVMLLISVLVAASSKGADAARIVRGVLAFDQSSAVLIGGLLFFLFLFASYFGLTWRDYVFGIALGLALFITVKLADAAILLQWGMVAANTVSTIESAAYNCSVVIWIAYCYRRQPVPAQATALPVHNLERWNEALLQLQ